MMMMMMMMMTTTTTIMMLMISAVMRGRSVTKVTEGITRGMGKLTFDTEYQNQMASREKAQNVRRIWRCCVRCARTSRDSVCMWATGSCRV